MNPLENKDISKLKELPLKLSDGMLSIKYYNEILG